MKAVIFDLDGVICSTDKYHFDAWKKLADSLDIYFDEKINNRLRGVSRMKSLEIILEKSSIIYSQKQKEDLANIKNDYYRELLEKMTPSDLDVEVKKTLDALKDKGLKLAIGSSSKNAKLILRQIGLDNYFDAVSDGTNIINTKPDPEVFLKAASMLNEKAEDCVVVEDAIVGIEAAHAGGFVSAGINDAKNSKYVNYKLESFSDLLSIL